MRALLLAIAFAFALAAPALAQDKSLPDGEPKDPRGVLPDQRVEVVNKEIAYAVERLEKAAEEGDETNTKTAFNQTRETIKEARTLFKRLPGEERAPFEAALTDAEGVLGGGDPRAGAQALRGLRQRMLELLAARG